MRVLEEGIGYATETTRIHYAFFPLWLCSFKGLGFYSAYNSQTVD